MFESKINRGKANGYAPLGSTGKVPLENLPPIQSTLNTGSFATTGSNTFTGIQTLSGTSGTGGAALTIGQLGLGVPDAFGIDVSASGSGVLTLTSEYAVILGASSGGFTPYSKTSTFVAAGINNVFNDGNGPVALIAVQNGNPTDTKQWIYNYDGKTYMPGDVNIGYDGFAYPTSGSLNIKQGNISVSGSIFVSGNIHANNLTGSNGTSGTSGVDGANGSQGPAGSSFTWAGTWDSETIYGDLNTVVEYQGSSYVCVSTATNLNRVPSVETGYWNLMAKSAFSGVDTGSLLHYTNTPTNLTGSNGDTLGLVAFDDNSIYYCSKSYDSGTYYVYGYAEGTHVIVPNVAGVPNNIQSTGWTITINGTPHTITGAYAPNGGDNYWYLEFDNVSNSIYTDTQLMTLVNTTYVVHDIWKKTDFGFEKTKYATTGSNVFIGNQSISGSVNISSSLIVSSTIVNNGTIDTINTDLIIESGDLTVTGSINQTGTFYADEINVGYGTMVQTTGSYVMTRSGSVVTYDSYDNIAEELKPLLSTTTATGPLSPWGINVPQTGSYESYNFMFDPYNSGAPSMIASGNNSNGYPDYLTIWGLERCTNSAGVDYSTQGPISIVNTGGYYGLCSPLGPGDCAIVRIQDLTNNRIYRATFYGSYNSADEGNEGSYGSITVERLL